MAKSNNELDLNEKLLSMSEKFKMDLDTEYIDSGSVIMNMVFGKGFPLGKMIEIYSESGYGKSTLVLSMCKKIAKQGYKILYFDAEGSITELIESMGFYKEGIVWSADNPDGCFIPIQTSYFEDIEEYLENVVPKYDDKGNPTDSDIKLVVIDSVAALCPKEYKGDFGEKVSIASAKPGVTAKLMTNFLRKFGGYKTAYNMSFLFINQMRDNLAMSFASKYEDNVPGGRALKYFMDVIIKLNSRGVTKNKILTGSGEYQEIPTEREVDVKAVKNKLTNGGIGLPLQIRFGIGISNIAAMPYLLPRKYIVNDKGEEVCMLINEKGSWYTLTFNEDGVTKQVRCNGLPKLKEAIRDNYRYIYPEIKLDDFKILQDSMKDEESSSLDTTNEMSGVIEDE